jgi:hypothetical protein
MATLTQNIQMLDFLIKKVKHQIAHPKEVDEISTLSPDEKFKRIIDLVDTE